MNTSGNISPRSIIMTLYLRLRNMSVTKIVRVHGRQVIDSRGNPTVEAIVSLAGRGTGSASCRAARAPASTRRGNCEKLCQERSEEHTSELQSLTNLVCRLLLEKKNRT